MEANRCQKGVDDVLAMLLAFASKPEELEILMLSLTFGNVEVQKYVSLLFVQTGYRRCQGLIRVYFASCLRNVVTLFHYIEKERAWRKANGRSEGFETLNVRKPIGMVLNDLSITHLLTGFFSSCCGCRRALGGAYDGSRLLS